MSVGGDPGPIKSPEVPTFKSPDTQIGWYGDFLGLKFEFFTTVLFYP